MLRPSLVLPLLLLSSCSTGSSGPAPLEPGQPGFFALEARALTGEPAPFTAWDGRVVLVVNVASECGFTSQYEGLQRLWESNRERGLVVIGFPCNQFLGQEPGSAAEIADFCRDEYGVTFPMMEKVDVKGDACSPVYAWLNARTGETPAWNFGKYLVSRDGATVRFFGTRTAPDDPELIAAIEEALAAR